LRETKFSSTALTEAVESDPALRYPFGAGFKKSEERFGMIKYFITIAVLLLAGHAAFAEQVSEKFIKNLAVTSGKLSCGAAASATVATCNGSGAVSYSAVPASGTQAQEIPTGACNDSNVTMTLAHTPISAGSVRIFLDGAILTQVAGKDYTISSGTITLAVACATGQTAWEIGRAHV
jgi:hypothetical protein